MSTDVEAQSALVPTQGRQPVSWLSRPHVLGVGALTAVSAALYSLYSIVNHRNFGTTIFDAVIFDQAVRGYSEFRAPTSAALGVFHGYGTNFPVLGDHLSPIIAVLAPLYWIHDGPTTLLLAQSVLFALAIVPLWLLARRMLGTGAAYLIGIAYALSWEVQTAVAFDFHEVAFAPVLMATMFEREQAGRRGQAVAAAGLLLLVKEDMGLAVCGFGLYLLTRRARSVGGGLAVGGVLYTWLATRFVIPFFGGEPMARWAYDALGDDVPSAALSLITDPLGVFQLATTPDVKVHTLLWIFVPVLFCALLSPMVMPALPLLAERLLADGPATWWGIWWQYDAFIVIPVFVAAADGARRLGNLLARIRLHGFGVAWAIVTCLLAVLLLPRFPLINVADPGWYQGDARVDARRAALATVPDGVTVAASNNLGPHLSSRCRVLLFDDDSGNARWVIADVWEVQYPFSSLDEQRGHATALVDARYDIVFQREGIVVLHRARPGTTSSSSA